MSTPEWFYANADEHVGPFSAVQMTALVRSGAVSLETLVWREGMVSWVPARQEFPYRSTPPPIPDCAPASLPVRPPATGAASTTSAALMPSARPGSIIEPAQNHWARLTRKQKAVTVVSVLSAVVAWQLTGGGLGNVVFLLTLATVAGATQFNRDPLKGRIVVLAGSATVGLITFFAFADSGDGWLIRSVRDDLSWSDVQARALVLLILSVATGVLARKRTDFGAVEEWEDPNSAWASWDDADATRERASATDLEPGPAPASVLSSELGRTGAPAGGVRPEAPVSFVSAPASPDESPQESSEREAPSPGKASGLQHEHGREGMHVIDAADDERGLSWVRRAAITASVAAVLMLAGWAGLGAYQRSQAAQARVDALEASVGSTVGADVDGALEAGQAAVDAQGDESRLNGAFGSDGAQNVRRLAGVYAEYERATAGTLRREVEARRAEVAQLESQAASARSGVSGFELRRFAVGRQFDTSASGAGMYEALDMTGYQKVVLRTRSETAAQIYPGRQVVLYVESEGEQAVTVTNSNAYRSFDTTEYYTVYRVEAAAEQVEALTRQIESDAASVRLTLSQIEAQLEAAIGVARENYWAGAGPIISSLQGSN